MTRTHKPLDRAHGNGDDPDAAATHAAPALRALLPNPTRHPLTEAARHTVVEALGPILADAIDLRSQVKEAHWIVKGPEFIAYHKLLDELADRVNAQSDALAERISTLGGRPQGTVAQVAGNTRLPPLATDDVAGLALFEQLSIRYAAYAGGLRVAMDVVGDVDKSSEDLLIKSLDEAELDLWFLESHLSSGHPAPGKRGDHGDRPAPHAGARPKA